MGIFWRPRRIKFFGQKGGRMVSLVAYPRISSVAKMFKTGGGHNFHMFFQAYFFSA